MPKSPVIVADADIPYLDPVLGPIGRVIPVPGHRIGPEDVRLADALVVRSVTNVNAALLQDSRIRFVGSATSGVDHVDLAWLRSRGIAFSDAAGANAESVVEYVLACIACGLSRTPRRLSELTIGVVGCGRIGRRLAWRAAGLGMRVLLNDPPLVRQGGTLDAGMFMDLGDLFERSDVVSVHVPLEHGGDHPTIHLVDGDGIRRMKEGTWLVQSSRGGTIAELAAVEARREGRLGFLALDVWESEPLPRRDSIDAADVATPHIAGYSRDAKLAGVLMIRDALADVLGVQCPETDPVPDELPDCAAFRVTSDSAPCHTDLYREIVPQLYDIGVDDARFRDAMVGGSDAGRAERFHKLRADYPARWAFSRFAAEGAFGADARRFLTDGIGVGTVQDAQ